MRVLILRFTVYHEDYLFDSFHYLCILGTGQVNSQPPSIVTHIGQCRVWKWRQRKVSLSRVGGGAEANPDWPHVTSARISQEWTDCNLHWSDCYTIMGEDLNDLRDFRSQNEEDNWDNNSDSLSERSESSQKQTRYAQKMKKMRDHLAQVKDKMELSQKRKDMVKKVKGNLKVSQEKKDMVKKPVLKLLQKNIDVAKRFAGHEN